MTDLTDNPKRGFSASFDDFLALMGQISDGVAVWQGAPWRVAYSNQAFAELAGLGGLQQSERGPNRAIQNLESRMKQVLDSFIAQGEEAGTATSPSGDHSEPVEIRLFRLRPDDDQFVGMIVNSAARGMPGVKNSADTGRRDALTGLPDRSFLHERLLAKLGGERIADRQFAIVFLDLDNFKQVNDSLGHLVGDAVLREAAGRIANCLREGDHVIRYGGDEFVALIEGVTDAREVEPIISRIHIAFANPIQVAGGEASLSLSAGVAVGSSAASSPEELLAAADQAMYAAKRTAL